MARRHHVTPAGCAATDCDDRKPVTVLQMSDDEAAGVAVQAARGWLGRVKPWVKTVSVALVVLGALGTVIASLAEVTSVRGNVDRNTEAVEKLGDRMDDAEKAATKIEAEARARDLRIDAAAKVRDAAMMEAAQAVKDIRVQLDSVATEQSRQAGQLDTAIKLMLERRP